MRTKIATLLEIELSPMIMAEDFELKQVHNEVFALKDLTYHSSLAINQISHDLHGSLTLIAQLKTITDHNTDLIKNLDSKLQDTTTQINC
jgi:outer membrane lipopolysaccharide assembly protein LptE/RlpB